MLKIGEFSKLSRVSIRMLRHYDDIGLLKPAEIDNFSGYRYYREEQLFAIGRITSLKDMGFALADIIKILDSYDDKEKMDAFLSERQKELSTPLWLISFPMKIPMPSLPTSTSAISSG